ncbi:MAG: hypothetical protein JWQ96_2004 [Segetibacter sp.]|nr:hypothetical protein [Segetibacter sp.]
MKKNIVVTSVLMLLITLSTRIHAQAVRDALARNDKPTVISLLEKGVDIYEYDSTVGTDNLMSACRFANNPERVAFLLKLGAEPDKNKSPKGRTALHVACAYYSCLNTIKLLVEAGADVNAKTVDGVTPLMLAGLNAKLEVVAYLLSKGATKDLKDVKGERALNYAQRSKDDEAKKWMQCTVDKTASIKLLQ